MIRHTTAQPFLSDSTGPIDGDEDRVAHSERELAGLALALGASQVGGWSAAEERLAAKAERVSEAVVVNLRGRIRAGEDPLGQAFCTLRPPAERRSRGATFTPPPIVDAMVQWAAERVAPRRIVDPGTGSGRYLYFTRPELALLRMFESAGSGANRVRPCASSARQQCM